MLLSFFFFFLFFGFSSDDIRFFTVLQREAIIFFFFFYVFVSITRYHFSSIRVIFLYGVTLVLLFNSFYVVSVEEDTFGFVKYGRYNSL